MLYLDVGRFEQLYCKPIFSTFCFLKKQRLILQNVWFERSFEVLGFLLLPIFFLFIICSKKLRKYLSFTLHEINVRRCKYDLTFRPNLSNLKDLHTICSCMSKAFVLRGLGFKTIVIGDPIYHRRFLADFGVLIGMTIYVTQNFIIYRYNDADIYSPNTETLSTIIKHVGVEEAEIYFSRKIKGDGYYNDSNIVFQSEISTNLSKVQRKIDTVYFHVFGDSAIGRFNDTSRISNNYFLWLDRLLERFADDDTNVCFRIHPSTKLWGENFLVPISKIRKLSLLKFSFSIEYDFTHNLESIYRSRRIFTFAGNIAQEAVALGRPAYTERASPMEVNFLDSFKCNSDENAVRSDPTKHQMQIAKQQIYLQEVVLSFKRFTGLNNVYSYVNLEADPQFALGEIVIHQNSDVFELIASRLAQGYSHSFIIGSDQCLL